MKLRLLPIALLLTFVGCATNPATGRRQFSLVSESQEIQIGKDADKDVVGSLGLYDDQATQAFVSELGARLIQGAERPNLPWTFRVVDDPVVNAFALPGGYLYVTRGILAHLGSEAELAGVVGHEIGHVTGRHGVDRMSKAQLATLGLGIGTILKPELKQVGDIASAGLGVLFLKYGRDDEYEADDLGLRYMTKAGYDPRPMAEVFTLLERVSLASASGRVPNWLSTHPEPAARRARIEARIADGGVVTSGTRVERESYLRRLEGMVYGDDPRQGFFEGAVFHHPEMRFRMRFPDRFKTSNQKDAVSGMSEAKDAMVRLSLSSAANADAAARALAAEAGVKSRSRRERVNGANAVAVSFEVANPDGQELMGEVMFVELDGRVFELLAVAPKERYPTWEDALSKSIRSLNRETEARVLEVEPMRIKLVEVGRDTPAARFAASYSAGVPAEQIYLINHISENDVIPRGTLAKRVVGAPIN